MRHLTPDFLTEISGGRAVYPSDIGSREVTAITTDSRRVSEGGLFIPLKGERADGHTFIKQVMEKGALLVLTEREDAAEGLAHITVASTEEALRTIAAAYLKEMAVPVVGITGSVGKTSTKETIAAVLGQKFRTLKTQGNFNNEIGLPLTVFDLRDEHEIAVLEMGISHFGDMKVLGEIAHPDIAVITNIGTCHLEYLVDRDGVFREKTDMFTYLKSDGRAVLNGDDDKLRAVESVRGRRPVFFGLGENNDYRAENITPRGLKGISCRIVTPDGSFEVTVPIPGEHMVLNALAACAVGRLCGLADEEIKAGIESLKPLGGRFNIIETPYVTVVDDCYNANPMSMKASVKLLASAEGRRVAILGDMAELGADEMELHREVGRFMKNYAPDLLITAGPKAALIAEEAGTIRSEVFPDMEAVKKALPDLVGKGDTVLVKASHCMHFEELVSALTQARSL